MSPSARHSRQTISQGIHSIVALTYNDNTERLSANNFSSYDLYKLVLVIDNNTFWIITEVDNLGNATWQNLITSIDNLNGDLSGTLIDPLVVNLHISGQTLGSILYFNGTNWVVLNPSTDGYVLTTHPGSIPTWSPVGMNNNQITASYTTPSTNNLISNINVFAGTTSNNLSALTFSNSNGLSFGLNGSIITGSYTVPTQTNQTIGAYFFGNTIGQSSSTFDARSISFSGLGAVSVGYSNNNVVISSPTRTVAQLPSHDNPWQTNFPISNASLSFQHFNPRADIIASQANLLMALNGNTNSTGALTISLGIYIMSGSTMALASSDSRQITWTSGNQTTNSTVYGGISGTRYRTVGLNNWSISAGEYIVGMWFKTENNGNWNAFGIQGPTIIGAQDVNETQAYLNGFSASSFSTSIPNSINLTNTNYIRTGGNALQQPGIIFLGTI